MSNLQRSSHVEQLAQYVQPRYRQNRNDVLRILGNRVASSAGSYPQVVDPTALELGDEITVIDAFEGNPLWKSAITEIIASLSPPSPEVMIFTEPAELLHGAFTRLVPDDHLGEELGLAKLSPDGQNLPGEHFAYTHVFLTGTASTVAPHRGQIHFM